ncbi:MAG: UvrB/UvrC motif-containing protein, partial [bacterium]
NKKTSLEEKLEEAIKNDDFEKAEEIKKKIENLRNKNNK